MHTKTYMAWANMRQMCLNRQSPRYIGHRCSITPRWDTFAQFLVDLGPRPDGGRLHRDRGANFGPETARWVT